MHKYIYIKSGLIFLVLNLQKVWQYIMLKSKKKLITHNFDDQVRFIKFKCHETQSCELCVCLSGVRLGCLYVGVYCSVCVWKGSYIYVHVRERERVVSLDNHLILYHFKFQIFREMAASKIWSILNYFRFY